MKKVIIEFIFNEKELGEGWFNIYNLELMLYSKEYTKRELLKVEEIANSKEGGNIIGRIMLIKRLFKQKPK